MRMRIGDLEMDSSTGITVSGDSSSAEISAESSAEIPAEIQAEVSKKREASMLLSDMVAVPQPLFLLAAFVATVAAVALTVFAIHQRLWLLLIPAPFLLRFAGYAAILGTRNLRESRPSVNQITDERRAELLTAIADRALSADDLARRIGWPEAQVLDALVALIEQGEIDEDLDVETGVWKYRRTVQLDTTPERIALPARERLEALQTTNSTRRDS